MTPYSQTYRAVRKTFNISEENADKMQKFLSPRKQTEFVNQALEHEFSRLEKEKKLKAINVKIQGIKRIKSSEPLVETLGRIREERDDGLLNSSTS